MFTCACLCVYARVCCCVCVCVTTSCLCSRLSLSHEGVCTCEDEHVCEGVCVFPQSVLKIYLPLCQSVWVDTCLLLCALHMHTELHGLC